MPQANALRSIGYTDTVLFLTIGKPDIYQHKSLGKSETVFIRVTKNYRNWLPTDLIFSGIDIWLTNIRLLYIYRITNSREEYPYIPQILDAFASGNPICTGNR